MVLTFYELLALFSFGFGVALFMFLAFALGAYVVYRAKREAHEPFINIHQPHGSAGQAYGQYVHEDVDDLNYEPPLGGDVDKMIYGDPKRREQFMQDYVKDVRQ